ncbi:hypothetical protein HYX03_02750 [Candidatus Woesearchaeota archaeon]|nr:hypothetical protein [Candidatus Woesearchaeota archaeon]
MGNTYMYTDDKFEKPRVILGNKVRRIMPDLIQVNRRMGKHRFPRWTGYGVSKNRHFDLRNTSLAYEHGYERGLNQPKLNNLYIGKKEQWHLHDAQDNDLGILTIAVLSDMTKGDVKIGPMRAMEHLDKEYELQKHSVLEDRQRMSPSNAKEEFVNPKEPRYSHLIAYIKDKKLTHGVKAVSFAAADINEFQEYEVAGHKLGGHKRFMDWFYLPIGRQDDGQDFGKFSVVKKNGHTEPLEKLVGRLALQHVNGSGLLAVHDAPERQLEGVAQYGFMALAPKFSIPKVNVKTVEDYSQPVDEVHIIIKPSRNRDSGEHDYGLEFGSAFSLYMQHIRESYFPHYASVRGTKVTPLRQKFEASMGMYREGINRLVDSAVKVDGKIIVPYKNASVGNLSKLNPEESAEFKKSFWEYALKDFAHYVKAFPDKK